jgi:metal-dependent amidase/aminoacylase/carboxypeptidase family protein
LQAGVDIQVGLRAVNKKFKDLGRNFVLTLPVMKSSTASNIISDTCEVMGILRTFDDEDTIEIKKDVEELIRSCCAKRKCKVDLFIRTNYPPVVNHKTETEHVLRVAKKVFEEKNIIISEKPFHASEDFSFYLRHRPGCFFFLSAAKDPNQLLHTSTYDPDDNVINYASEMYLQLVFDRFGVNTE